MTDNSLAGLTVLILEDEFLIAMDVEQICRDHGADNVIVKRSVAELGDEIWSEKFDVVLVDLMLSGQSTLPFAKTLRDRKIPFLFASGYTDVESLMGDFPGVSFIGKPYPEAGLVNALRDAVDKSGR